MDRTQALKTMGLGPTADGRSVEEAYWERVRRAQARADRDEAARLEVEALNEAYASLAPHIEQMKSARAAAPPSRRSAGTSPLDSSVDWLFEEAGRTRRRWSRRNPEIAVIAGAVAVLAFFALDAGASLVTVGVVAMAVCAAIWSPWRRPED